MPDYDKNPVEVLIGGTGNLPTTNELPVDMHKKLFRSEPQLAPLLSILSRVADEGSTNFRIDWQEENDIPVSLIVGVGLASGGTTFTPVANAASVPINSLLFNTRTFDMAEVTAAPTVTATTLTLSRSEGGTTEAAWIAGDVIEILPPAVAEDENEVFRPVSVADSNVFNFHQLIRLQFAITRTMNAVSTHFGGPGAKRAKLKEQKFREFRKKWEKLIMMGGRATSGTAPSTQRLSGGLVHYLRNGTLYKDYNGIFTQTGFDNLIGDYHDQNPDATNIKLFAAPNVLRQITYFASSKVRISPESTKFGLHITNYIGGPLNISMVPCPLLNSPQTRGWGWFLDMDRIKLKTLERTQFIPDAKGVGNSELIYDTFRAQASLLLANESRHLMFVGALL